MTPNEIVHAVVFALEAHKRRDWLVNVTDDMRKQEQERLLSFADNMASLYERVIEKKLSREDCYYVAITVPQYKDDSIVYFLQQVEMRTPDNQADFCDCLRFRNARAFRSAHEAWAFIDDAGETLFIGFESQHKDSDTYPTIAHVISYEEAMGHVKDYENRYG